MTFVTEGTPGPATSSQSASSQVAKQLPRDFIGPYRLIREIGAGGIGAVYLAERLVDGISLRSAVKILAPHAVDASFIERFHREQQHLAALDHANITRLLDAGWDQHGQPYLVMDYIDGVHLDAHCDARGLGIDARLRLFLQVCDAVSHAHRNLILHLDLKPSNVLVTGGGVVKLLDFGTSKLVQFGGVATSTMMASPTYASPEQLLNEPVSTASDVYSLGAMLFELLTGRAPFGNINAPARIEAAMRAVEPDSITKAVSTSAAARRGLTKPKLHSLLLGDLAAIVAACLRPQSRDRYPSVETLSDEVERYLSCRPVMARRQTIPYMARKFVRRHRLPAAAVCGVALAVGASLMYAWLQQEHALREAERSVRMQTFLFSLFKMANPQYTGKPVASVSDFLRVGMAKLPDYIREPADLREAQLGLAESMFESGDFADARATFADIIADAARANAPADKAEAETFAGSIEFQQGRVAAGRALERDALRLSQAPNVPPRVRVLAQIYFAFNEENNGFTTEENLRLLRAAIAASREQRLPRETALGLSSLGSVLYMRGQNRDAKPIFEQLLRVYEADPLALCDRSDVYGWLAWINSTTDDIEGSLPMFRKAYDGLSACSGPSSRAALDQLPYWADALIRLQRAPEAVAMLENALPAWRGAGVESAEQAAFLYFLARGYAAVGRFADAERTVTEYLDKVTGKLAPNHRMIGVAHLVLGEALAGQHRYPEAMPHAVIAVDLLVKSAVSTYGHTLGAEAVQLAKQVREALNGAQARHDVRALGR